MKTLSALTEEVSKSNDQKQQKAKQIFLGIDAHLARNQVARKKDNGGIQAVQSFRFEELLLFAQKQVSSAEEVYAVYEAGPLGYVLYRRLRELGIKAYVSAPECLEQGKRKHNKLDARKLASRLYSYVQGDSEMMGVVRVPSPQEEQLRAHSRQYDQLVETRKSGPRPSAGVESRLRDDERGLVAANCFSKMEAVFTGVARRTAGGMAK